MEVGADFNESETGVQGPINLAELAPSGQQRGVVRRNVFEDPRTDFPDISVGTLSFSDVPRPGENVSGSFNVTFIQGTEFGCGRTVFGSFEGSVP